MRGLNFPQAIDLLVDQLLAQYGREATCENAAVARLIRVKHALLAVTPGYQPLDDMCI